jgi:LmbE family N-acetylglucosaminyl deacetylase
MIKLDFGGQGECLRVLCLGAHSDDLEIGCGGTVLEWLATRDEVEVTWVVFSALGQRSKEARESANEILSKAKRTNLVLRDFRDGYFPVQFEKAKDLFEELKANENPDVIFTHRLEDRHQDHRLVAELTWQTFRDHLILEYEIPKYEGDLGQPNVFVALSNSAGERKVEHLLRYFGTQRAKSWFRSETFLGLMQVRGIECRAPSGMAEGFHVRKATI